MLNKQQYDALPDILKNGIPYEIFAKNRDIIQRKIDKKTENSFSSMVKESNKSPKSLFKESMYHLDYLLNKDVK